MSHTMFYALNGAVGCVKADLEPREAAKLALEDMLAKLDNMTESDIVDILDYDIESAEEENA